MQKKFEFDYDPENDSLFMYDSRTKSKASIEIEDMIIDYNNKKEIVGIELLNATQFFKELSTDETPLNQSLLKEIIECKIEIIPKNNFILIKFLLQFKSNKKLTTPIIVPTITEPSPALAY